MKAAWETAKQQTDKVCHSRGVLRVCVEKRLEPEGVANKRGAAAEHAYAPLAGFLASLAASKKAQASFHVLKRLPVGCGVCLACGVVGW